MPTLEPNPTEELPELLQSDFTRPPAVQQDFPSGVKGNKGPQTTKNPSARGRNRLGVANPAQNFVFIQDVQSRVFLCLPIKQPMDGCVVPRVLGLRLCTVSEPKVLRVLGLLSQHLSLVSRGLVLVD
ncbi:hypothetical protein CDAR_298051 [Caerostris darwini]|uniref:Uncharacterized protein n=1 Tax=Caerostris darwini TaxID=1538125 RepID=A0AAV4Q0J7_9ARAC|nr:hypothetical protein CDAR_298051 [Caerostris darwini]